MAFTVASVSVVVAMGGTKHFRTHQPPPPPPSTAPDLTTSNSRPTASFSSSRPDIVFVVNPGGANGRTGKEWKKLLPSLKSRLGHLYNVHENFTSGPGHAMDITREAIRDGVNAVIAVGGDGTLHEVVNGFFWDGKPVSCEDASASGATALGLIPLGTGSDFARTYGWRNDPHEGIERIAKGLRSWINVGVIYGENRKEHYFINVADLHLSAKAGYYASRYKRFGNLCYVIGALQGFMGHRNQDLRIKIDDGKWEVFSNVTALCIGNAKYFGGGMKITPNADPSSESFEQRISKEHPVKLMMVVLQDFEWYDFILNLQKLYNGTHLSVNNVTSIRARTIEIEEITSTGQIYIQSDGEHLGFLPRKVHLLPRAVQMIT